jgi:hypothetical protein
MILALPTTTIIPVCFIWPRARGRFKIESTQKSLWNQVIIVVAKPLVNSCFRIALPQSQDSQDVSER